MAKVDAFRSRKFNVFWRCFAMIVMTVNDHGHHRSALVLGFIKLSGNLLMDFGLELGVYGFIVKCEDSIKGFGIGRKDAIGICFWIVFKQDRLSFSLFINPLAFISSSTFLASRSSATLASYSCLVFRDR